MKTSELKKIIDKKIENDADMEIMVMVNGYAHKVIGADSVHVNYLNGEHAWGIELEIDETGIEQHVLEGAWQKIEDHFRHAQRIREELYRLEEAKEKIEDIKQVCPEIGIALTVAGKNIDKRINDCKIIIDSERNKS